MTTLAFGMRELCLEEIENVAGAMSDETESFLWGFAIALAIMAL